jgi:hypothetical protein
MGFFDFLKKPKEEVKPVVDSKPVDVGIDSMEKEIGEHVSDMLSREKGKAKDLYGRIRSDFREIKKLNSELGEKKFEEGEKRYSAVNMIKNNYVNRTFGLLGGVPPVREMNHEELENFLSKTTKVLDGMRKVPPKQAILLSKYFKKEASEIVKILKKIEDNLNGMRSLLSDGKPIPLVNRINSRVSMITSERKKFKDLEQQERVIREKVKKLKSEREGKGGDLEKFLKSEGYRKLIDSKERIKDLKQERENLANEIREEFSSIKRPMKKYEHVLRNDRSIPREKRISLEKLVHSPLKTVLDEGGESVLAEMISRVENAIKEREIGLKESERKKFKEFSGNVRKGKVSGLKKKYEGIKREMEEAERQRDKESVAGEREKIRREIENLDHEISEYERNLENFSKGKESTKSRILEEKEELEKTLERELGKKFRIKLF